MIRGKTVNSWNGKFRWHTGMGFHEAGANPRYWKLEWPKTDFTKHSVPFKEIFFISWKSNFWNEECCTIVTEILKGKLLAPFID